MKTLTIADIHWQLFPEYEPADPVAELSECMSPEEAGALAYLAQTNPWMWCRVHLRGTYRGILQADAYLGCCSYANEQDFLNGGYNPQMQEEIRDELQGQLNTLLQQ